MAINNRKGETIMKEGIGRIDLSDLNQSHYKSMEPIINQGMESIMQYPDKGYDVEIWMKTDSFGTSYTADIKYPCGELVEGIEGLRSKRTAVYLSVCAINKLPYANHEGCTDEYCQNNKYLKPFRG